MKISKQYKVLFFSFLIALFIWSASFIIRFFFVDKPDIEVLWTHTQKNIASNPLNITLQYFSDGDSYNAFKSIFKNNIKGCLYNILGGVIFGLGTILNLFYNGFSMGDYFAFSINSGVSIKSLLIVTLPHSFELVGFWLSGGVGFYIAWKIIRFMLGKEEISFHFYRMIGLLTLVVFLIIISAAYIEAYVSINMLK